MAGKVYDFNRSKVEAALVAHLRSRRREATVADMVAGTTGAGDAAIAGFLASLAKGLPPEDALTMAVAVGACCVEEPDATSGVRSWDATAERVKGGWRRARATVPEGGWSCGPDGTWHGPNDRG